MKIYIAAHLGQRERARELARVLVAAGHEITSRWIDDPGAIPGTERSLSLEDRRAVARGCQDDVDAADVTVALVSPETRGTLVEIGYAVGRLKRVILSGNPYSVTCMVDLEGVLWVESDDLAVEAAIEAIRREVSA